RERKEGGIGRGRERIACHLRAERLQPEAEPAALEAGMPGHEDGLALPEAGVYQIFHGAFPELHRSSRLFLSRSVSIGRQKPWCRYDAIWPLRARFSIGSFSQSVWSPSM